MQKKNSSSSSPPPAPVRTVSAERDGQRLDNYLAREMKGAPRALIYRLVRTGQVRINGGRAAPDCKLQEGDRVRIPPHVTLSAPKGNAPPASLPVLFEDQAFLAVNKPAGMAVHGGSGAAFGVIERLRAGRKDKFLELAHRLDKNTSGVLLLAKKSSALRAVQHQWRERKVEKIYLTLVFGQWHAGAKRIDMPLARAVRGIGGKTAEDGRPALTRTFLLRQFARAALLRADIATGRTHQLRVHLATVGLPIAGDDKYGDFAANRLLPARLRRTMLHAAELRFTHPQTGDTVEICAPPPDDFQVAQKFLQSFTGKVKTEWQRSNDNSVDKPRSTNRSRKGLNPKEKSKSKPKTGHENRI